MVLLLTLFAYILVNDILNPSSLGLNTCSTICSP